MKNFALLLCTILMLGSLLSSCSDPEMEGQLAEVTEKLANAEAAVDSLNAIIETAEKAKFIHTVFFWLKDGISEEERASFEKNLRSLEPIESIRAFHVGPTAGTPRDVVDNSYDYALIVHFEDAAGHDIYADHPIHLAFIEAQNENWVRVQVYDSLSQ